MNSGTKEKDPSEEFENLPKSIGAYDIKEKINEGEFSKIYLGISKYTNDKVAIKIINKLSFLKNPNGLYNIKNEIEVLKILKHRNILTLYEIYESNKYIFIITEYLPTELSTLIINKKRLSESDAVKIFLQIIDAFQYMHKLQICHRDFCLEHIMLDNNNIPKIIDFGLSTFYKKGEKLNEPISSLLYACPEIIQKKEYDPELADVWSLGVCLYVMICGYLPFSEEDDEKNNELIISGKVEYPSEIGNICKDLLKKMLEVDPKKRINLLKITRHPWIKGCKDFKIIGGYNVFDMVYPIDERLLKIIKEYGIVDTNKLEQDLKDNKYNKITALFKLITKKTLSLGYGCISDFTSNAFVDYMKNKDKVISDGNQKYQDHMDKINNNNNELKKIIAEYKSKQENVIKQLDELKNTNIDNEENKKDEIPIKEEKKEEQKNNEKNNIIVDSDKKEKEEIKTMKSEEYYEKDEKSENNKEEENNNNKSKKEMRFSISFDDEDEDKEKSDNDNNDDNNKNDEEKSEEKQEKESSIQENKEQEKENIDKKEEEINEVKEKEPVKERKKIKIEKELRDEKIIKISGFDSLIKKLDEIEKTRIKIEEEKKKEKEKETLKQKEKEIIKDSDKNKIIENNKNPEIKEIKILDKNEINNNEKENNKNQLNIDDEINKKEKVNNKIETDINEIEAKETRPTETKETLLEKEKEIIYNNKKEEEILSDEKTIEENEDYLRNGKTKIDINKINNKKDEKEETPIIPKENLIKDVNLDSLILKQKKTIIKNKKINNEENKEKINIVKKEDDDNNNYLITKSKKLNHKKSDKKVSDLDKNIKLEINNNNKKSIESKIEIPIERKIIKDKDEDNDNDKILLKSIKPNNKKEKLNIKKENKEYNKNNFEIKENIDNDILNKKIPSITKKKQKIKNEELIQKKENIKEHKIEKENLSMKKRNINLDKKLNDKLNNIHIEKVSKPTKKFETISQFKEKQNNKSKKNIRSKNHINNKNQDNGLNIISQKSINKKITNKEKDKDKEKEEIIEFKPRKHNLNHNQKSNEKRKIISTKNEEKINGIFQISTINTKNNPNCLTISHVNDINYLGEYNDNNYQYLKNRVIRFNNNKIPENDRREEYKDNYDFYDNDHLGDNLYIDSEYDNKKRKVMFTCENNAHNDINRLKRLERQKNKLKEELRRSGNPKYLYKKNSNNNPINKKENKTNEDNNYKNQTIKIVNKNHININRENENFLLNKKEKYEKNRNDQYLKTFSLDNANNFDYTQSFQTPKSINTKIKNDPLKFITHYYISKDKLNKITNNKQTIEEENNNNELDNEYNKYKNINFLEILKLIKDSKKNNLEYKLHKFKGKQPEVKKLNIINCRSSDKIPTYSIINKDNDNNYPPKTFYNRKFQSIELVRDNNQYNLINISENDHFQQCNNNTSSKKRKYKRVISTANYRKVRNENFRNTERRLSSCKRMCHVCNKAYRDNSDNENNVSNCITDRYNSHKSNSVYIKRKKPKIKE